MEIKNIFKNGNLTKETFTKKWIEMIQRIENKTMKNSGVK